jgi:hypothetical protein
MDTSEVKDFIRIWQNSDNIGQVMLFFPNLTYNYVVQRASNLRKQGIQLKKYCKYEKKDLNELKEYAEKCKNNFLYKPEPSQQDIHLSGEAFAQMCSAINNLKVNDIIPVKISEATKKEIMEDFERKI